jgi:hypothetical protein
VVVPTPLGVEPGKEVPFRQMDRVLTPRREVGQGGPVPRGGGTPFDNGLAPAAQALCRLSGYGLGEVFTGLGETFDEDLLKHLIQADLERK